MLREGGCSLIHSAHTPSARANQKKQIWGLCPSASLRSFGRSQIWKYVEERKNNAKFSGHYVRPRTQYVRTKMFNEGPVTCTRLLSNKQSATSLLAYVLFIEKLPNIVQ